MEKLNNDIILFKRIKEDDRLALNTLFAHYYQKLCSFANTYLRNPEEAEEVVSDVFLILWKNRSNLSIEKNVASYLYVAVRHASLASLRKRLPSEKDIDDASLQNTLHDTNTPEQLLTFKEFQQRLENTIENLPPRCKQVFLMSRVESLTYKEISNILGISEKTVGNHLVNALSHLREWLSQYHREEPHRQSA